MMHMVQIVMGEFTVDFQYGPRVSRYNMSVTSRGHETIFDAGYEPGDYVVNVDNPDTEQVRHIIRMGILSDLFMEETFANMFAYKNSVPEAKDDMKRLFDFHKSLLADSGKSSPTFEDYFSQMEKKFEEIMRKDLS